MKKIVLLLAVIFGISVYAKDSTYLKESQRPITFFVPDSVCKEKVSIEQNYKAWREGVEVSTKKNYEVVYKGFSRQLVIDQEFLSFDKNIGKNSIIPSKEYSYPKFVWELLVIGLILAWFSFSWIKKLKSPGGNITSWGKNNPTSKNFKFLMNWSVSSFFISVFLFLNFMPSLFFLGRNSPIFVTITCFSACFTLSVGLFALISNIYGSSYNEKVKKIGHSYGLVFASMILLVISLTLLFGVILPGHIMVLWFSIVGLLIGIGAYYLWVDLKSLKDEIEIH